MVNRSGLSRGWVLPSAGFRWRDCAVVVGFGLGRWDVADGFGEPPIVVPVDPFQGAELDGVQPAPGPSATISSVLNKPMIDAAIALS